MNPPDPSCACCGTPTPAPERIIPIGIQWKPLYVRHVCVAQEPALVLWQCPGARDIDAYLLRFGVFASVPWSCGTTRTTKWGQATFDLRRRALIAEQLHYALNGLI